MKNRNFSCPYIFMRAFTLIEVMLTLAIIGILAAIAYPNLSKYLIEARRAEAQSEMLKIQLSLEKWRANNTDYNANLSTNLNFTDSNPYYDYTITDAGNGAPTASLYVIRGTAQGSQSTADSNCASLTLNQSSLKGPSGCWKGSGS